MPLKVFKILLLKSTWATLYATKNNSVILKTYNQLDIEQLGMCTVKLMHKDKSANCRFLVVPGDGPALLWMPDIQLLNILRITCEVIGDLHKSRKINSQIIEASNNPSCKTSRALWHETDETGTQDNNTNIPDYFGSSTNKAADKKQVSYWQINT